MSSNNAVWRTVSNAIERSSTRRLSYHHLVRNKTAIYKWHANQLSQCAAFDIHVVNRFKTASIFGTYDKKNSCFSWRTRLPNLHTSYTLRWSYKDCCLQSNTTSWYIQLYQQEYRESVRALAICMNLRLGWQLQFHQYQIEMKLFDLRRMGTTHYSPFRILHLAEFNNTLRVSGQSM